jgi:perosamine synthetase
MRIPLSRPDIGQREIELVTRVLRSGRLSMGPMAEEFEEKFAEYVGRRYAVAVSSGTAALHLCVAALGIGPKDEVITTPFTFVASTNCLLYEQAVPSFVDIDPATLNLDPALVRQTLQRDYMADRGGTRLVNRLNGRTARAILPVHVFGLPCDMLGILQIANEWGLFVIEDACEALGARLAGRRAGSMSHAAAFAFYPNKQMTTGEGGMVVTDDSRVAEFCRAVRNQGRDSSASWLRHEYLGFNYRLSEIHCALGIAQLERIDEFLAARAAVADAYTEMLRDITEIGLPTTPTDSERSWFTYVIQLKGSDGPALREQLMAGLRARGIECQAYFPSVHRQPYLEDFRLLPQRSLRLAESASERCLALPLFSSMTREQVNEVCAAVHEVLAEKPSARARPARAAQQRARGAA